MPNSSQYFTCALRLIIFKKYGTNYSLSPLSYSKPDQVIYSGSVKTQEKVREFQEEIGPEIVQTIKVYW